MGRVYRPLTLRRYRFCMDATPDDRRSGKRIALTPEMSAALRAQVQRTGVTPYTLLKRHLGPSHQIKQTQLYRWMRGAAKTVCPRRYGLVLERWESLPDRDGRYVLSTPQILALLRKHRVRTGVGVAKLLSRRDDLPEGLAIRQMENFYRGWVGKIRREHLDYVLDLWRALPDREFVPLTPEILSTLRGHIARTGKGAHAILRGARGKPDGLNAALIRSWLSGRASARKDQIDYVLKVYETLEKVSA